MGNSEFVEIISPNAKAQIEDIMKEVDKLAKKITDIPKFQLSNSPSGADDNIKKLTSDLALQAKEIDNLKAKLAGLNQEKQKSVAITTQQKVDNAIILKQEKQQATLTSAYADAYAKLNAQRTIAKTKLQDLIASERASTAEIRKAQKEFDVLNKKVAAADKAVGRFSEANRKINGLSQSVGNLMTAFGVGTGLYLAVDIAKNIFETTKALQSMDLALKMVSGSQQEFIKNQGFLRSLAEQYGIEIKGLTKNFTEFWVASKGKLEAEQIKAIFTSISKSVAVMGLSVEQQDSAFLALQQMMSKGTVQAEELKKQLGNALPGAVKAATMAYQALHPELKVTEKLFMEQMKAGKVISSELLPELAKAYEKLYGIENVKRAETLQAAQERLKNSWTDLVRSMNESKTGGLSLFFSFIFDGLTNGIKLLARFNSDWDSLYAKATSKGKSLGASAFTERVAGAGFATSTREEKLNMVLDKARKELIVLRKQESEINKEISKFNPYAINLGKSGKDMKKEKEQILLDIAARAEIIRLAKIELQPKEIPKTKEGATETEDTRKKREASELKADKDRLKSIEDLATAEYDLKLSNLEREKEIIKDLRDNKETSLEDMLFLEQAYAYKELQIAQAVYDEEMRLSKENDGLKTIALNELLTKKENIIKESQERQLREQEKFNEEQIKASKKWYLQNPPIGVFETGSSKEEREKKIEEHKQDLKNQAKIFNEFAGDFANKSGFSQTFDNFLKEDKNGVSLFDSIVNPDSSMEAQERTKATLLVISSAFQDTLSLIDQAEEERHQRALSRLEKERDVALKFAGDSEAAKNKINEEFDKKKKALEIKEFKRKQKMSIANIAIDTAQAAMASWAKTGFPWAAAAAIAMGAIQAAIVASQKPPEYWKGTDNAEAGLAWTQERGAEIVMDKNNRIKSFGSDGGAQLTMMEKGDKVKTASETKKIMFDNNLNSILSDNGIKEAKIEIINKGLTIDEMDKVMSKHFANIQTNHTSFDSRGIQSWSEKNGNKKINNSNRGSGAGFKV